MPSQDEKNRQMLRAPVDDGSTGIEFEHVSSNDLISEPFDPTQVRVITQPMTIDLLVKRIEEDALELSPSFQRRAGIWSDEAQSRLIESLLLRIPLPAFYMDATDEDHWLVIDGLQRLTTLKRFVIEGKLRLHGLEFLTQFDGYTYQKLPPKFKRRIRETQVTVSKIEPGTPPDLKFNIFKRINTGGLPLSAQEIRHALNQGIATDVLAELASSKEFLEAIVGISDQRMADRELVLRFIAFTLHPYTEYKARDFDSFLSNTMAIMNKMTESELSKLKKQFLCAMQAAQRIFGQDAFRKRYDKEHRRYPLNKALFESWSVNLAILSDSQLAVLINRKEKLIQNFMDLMNQPEFNHAVSQGTGHTAKVKIRFAGIQHLIEETLL